MRALLLLALLPSIAFGTSYKDDISAASKSHSKAESHSHGGSVGDIDVSTGAVEAHGGVSESYAAGGDGGDGGVAKSAASIGDVTYESPSASAEGGQGGNSTASGGSVGDINITRRSASGSIRNTPNAYAPTVYPSVPCFKSGSAAGSGPGISLAIGGGRIDKGCEKRELIRLAYQMGMTSQAEIGWCQEAVRTKMFPSLEDCLPPKVVPPAYNDEVMIRLESVESVQMDDRAALEGRIEELEGQLASERQKRSAASKAAQARRNEWQKLAKDYGIGG